VTARSNRWASDGTLWLLVPTACLLRWSGHGISLTDGLRALAFLFSYVLLPGVALAYLLRLRLDGAVARLSLGGALGMAHLTITFLLGRLLGSQSAWLFAPLLVGVTAVVSWIGRRGSSPWSAGSSSRVELAALVFIALLAQQQRALYSPERLESTIPTDLLFHAGNAAELKHHFPPQDPRIGGRELPYHFFSGIPPCAASVVTGLPVGKLALVVLPSIVISWMVFALAHAGRVFGGTDAAGVCAAALVMFHLDFAQTLGLPRDGFLSLLRSGLYLSDSTLLGLAGLLPLAVLLAAWHDEKERPAWRLACAMVALSLWLSGTKASVMPVVVAGLLLTAVLTCVVRGQARAARPFTAALLLGIGAAPFALWLLTRHGSYSEMFRWAPGNVAVRSLFYNVLARDLGLIGMPGALAGHAWGVARPLLRLLLTSGWIVGFLGLGAVLGAVRLGVDRRQSVPRHSWILAITICGLAIALAFDTPSLSQLYFAYNGQVLLAVLGGGFVVQVVRNRRVRWVAIPLLLLAAAPMVRQALMGAIEGLGADLDAALQPASAEATHYVAGLEWIRANTSPRAVLVTKHGALAPSILAERRSFYSTGLFTPEGQRRRLLGLDPEPFPEWLALRTRAVDLDPMALRSIAALLGGDPELLVIVDAVEVSGEPGVNTLRVSPLPGKGQAPAGMALLYSSDVMRVYLPAPSGETDPAACERDAGIETDTRAIPH
jgi:hypothetical protein